MSLFEQIEKDYIQAYKAKDSVRLTVLRLLKTAVKNKLVDLCRPGGTLDDGDRIMEPFFVFWRGDCYLGAVTLAVASHSADFPVVEAVDRYHENETDRAAIGREKTHVGLCAL